MLFVSFGKPFNDFDEGDAERGDDGCEWSRGEEESDEERELDDAVFEQIDADALRKELFEKGFVGSVEVNCWGNEANENKNGNSLVASCDAI